MAKAKKPKAQAAPAGPADSAPQAIEAAPEVQAAPFAPVEVAAPTAGPVAEPQVEAPVEPAVEALAPKAKGRIRYPRTIHVQNNTPIPIYLSEAGKQLAANYSKAENHAVVTYQTADHFAREMANIDAIASVHGFTEPLVFSEPTGSDGISA